MVAVNPGLHITLAFNPADAKFGVEGDDLILTLEDGSQIVLEGLISAAQSGDVPTIQIAGVDIAADALVEQVLQRQAVRYDRKGDYHYDTISAFIKSIRGSDADGGLYWLARMLEAGEDARFIARRLVILASEDIGMADSTSLLVADAAARAVEFVGLPPM